MIYIIDSRISNIEFFPFLFFKYGHHLGFFVQNWPKLRFLVISELKNYDISIKFTQNTYILVSKKIALKINFHVLNFSHHLGFYA